MKRCRLEQVIWLPGAWHQHSQRFSARSMLQVRLQHLQLGF